MLVLSRTVDQKIIIGEGENATTLTIIRIEGDLVRLGFDAPKAIPIDREEIRKSKMAEGADDYGCDQ